MTCSNTRKTLLLVVGSVLLFGCGVKDRPANGGNQPISPLTSGELPAGVSTSKEKKFLVRASQSTLNVGRVEVTYRVITSELEPVAAPDYVLSVKYHMPDMPTMPVSPAEVKYLEPGKIQVTYGISMGGTWRIDLDVVKSGHVADSLSYATHVPE